MSVADLSDMPADIPELCGRLHRETNAQAVLVLGPEGEILGHAGSPNLLDDAVVEAIGDTTVETLGRGGASDPTDVEDRVREVGTTQLCAAPLANRAVLVVAFDGESSLTLVRLRMKRARELILRSLEAS